MILTKKFSLKLDDSRIKAIAVLQKHLGNQKIKTFISASGTSFYGTKTTDEIFTEAHQCDISADDFLGHISVQWENAALSFLSANVRTLIIRTPVVLSHTGGALEKITAPFKYFPHSRN